LSKFCFCNEFLKRWIATRRNHHDFVSTNAERLEEENNLHIKGTAKTKETDHEMPWTTGESGGTEQRKEQTDHEMPCTTGESGGTGKRKEQTQKIKRASKNFWLS
jgi:hypothetical protein